MSPSKGKKMPPKFTKISSDEEAADKKSSNSPYGKALRPVRSQSYYLIKIHTFKKNYFRLPHNQLMNV